MTTEPRDSAEARKARGAFFTPRPVCDYMVRWAVRSPQDEVLEPSAGEAAFMVAAVDHLRDLGADRPGVTGYELHEASATLAWLLVRAAGVEDPNIKVGDFLDTVPEARYSAVVGNPPYIRYQGFQGEARAAGLRAALAQGVRLTNLASSWAAFVVHSAAFLRPDGRLALVLPAELLSSNYAADIRGFLLRRFAEVRIVLFDRHVFPGVQTEAVLLLAEGHGGTDEVKFGRVERAEDLNELKFTTTLRPTRADEKWTRALADPAATDALTGLLGDTVFTQLNDWGRISLGAVTGSNSFFTLTTAEAQRWGLGARDLVRISPPGSSHLRGLSLGKKAYKQLQEAGARTLLFSPSAKPSAAALSYARAGEEKGVHLAYKCRIRDPWWRVPLQPAPDLFFTYMNAQTPQLCANPLRLRHLNSVHGVFVADSYRDLAQLLPVACLNSATMLSAEVVGRSYGGGILKMEPREAASLAVPSPDALRTLGPSLALAVPKVRSLLRRGRLGEAVTVVDAVLLENGLAVSRGLVENLRSSRNLLAQRRFTRAASAKTGLEQG